jgi:hypothetical protein
LGDEAHASSTGEQLVPDDIWEAIAPLLPAHPP